MAAAAAAMKTGLILAVVAVFSACVVAQNSSGCPNVLISLSPCLNYITGNSSTPSSSCCSQLSSVIRSQPQCLCEVLNGGGSSLGITVNQTQALALPSACKVTTPSASLCKAASPSGSPTESPTAPSGTTNTIPSTEGDGSSDGSSLKISIPQFSMLLFTASYASIY